MLILGLTWNCWFKFLLLIIHSGVCIKLQADLILVSNMAVATRNVSFVLISHVGMKVG